MARPAPAVTRTLAVLDFLAGHARETFTLSELARALGANLATMHALVNAMVGAGYLVRDDERRTYGLGPAVIGLGHAALARHPHIDAARQQMQRLSDEFAAECLASVPFGDEIVVVARSGPAHPHRPLAGVGQRLRMVPPLGVLFVAWDEARAERWITSLGAHLDRASIEEVRSQVDDVRALGYGVGLIVDGTIRRVRATRRGGLDVRRSVRYEVGYVGAPVFDAQGNVTLVVNIDGFREPMTGAEVEQLGIRMRDDMLTVARSAGGAPPNRFDGTGPSGYPAL